MQGAATCFYAFIGFDIIATTGEEAKSPNTSIPYAITASLITCLTAYVSVSGLLCLVLAFYQQGNFNESGMGMKLRLLPNFNLLHPHLILIHLQHPEFDTFLLGCCCRGNRVAAVRQDENFSIMPGPKMV